MKSPASPQTFSVKLLHPRHWLTWIGLAIFGLLAWLPWQGRHWLGQQLGDFIYKRNNKRRRIVLTNLQRCFPDLSIGERDQLTRRSLREYGCALLDYSILFFRSRTWINKHVDIIGREKLDVALQQNKNIVLLLGHSVWLEFAPLAIGQHYRCYGSYKPLKNPVLNWLVASSRLKDVEFVVAREEGMIKLVRSIEPGRLLFFLPDEDHGEKHSVFAPFFDTPKATLTTPARIAKLTNANCFPVMTFFDTNSGRHHIHIGEQLSQFGHSTPEGDAALMNQGFEVLIKEHPEQYMWLLKLFKTSPPGCSKLYQPA